jgi:serine/threonine protein kinase
VLNKTEITDPRSDLYSLAITVYELIAGKPPFLHSNPELLMNLQISYPLPESRAIPHPVYEILKKAAAKHRFPLPPSRYSSDEIDNMLEEGKQKRYSSATEMKDAIQKILNQLPEQENFWKKLTG